MIAYEFTTELNDSGILVIPTEYRRKLHSGAAVRVILMQEEETGANGSPPDAAEPSLADAQPTLAEIVAEIQRLGPNPKNITPASGRLAERLANPITQPEPDFDLAAWEAEWRQVEAEMEAESLAHEEAERLEWAK